MKKTADKIFLTRILFRVKKFFKYCVSDLPSIFVKMAFVFSCVVFFTFLVSCSSENDVKKNYITIREKQGITTRNYPIQIGRPFLKGEIYDVPSVKIHGEYVSSQADIKNYYSDGSVKFAIISFLVPVLKSKSSVKVYFVGGGPRTAYSLTGPGMLKDKYDFDAEIALTSGKTVKASARKMIEKEKFSYWASGPVATTVVIADHSADRSFDMGFDEHNSFRPIFHVTFWPKLKKYHVRYVGEIANTESLQDMNYSLQLSMGYNNKTTVYSKSVFNHNAMSRWTYDSWSGGIPGEIEIDHNLKYIISTGFFPNYRSGITASNDKMNTFITEWKKAKTDIADNGLWTKDMTTKNGTAEYGPYPLWTVFWIMTMNYQMREMSLKSADLAAFWPVHIREGDSNLFYDREGKEEAIGLPVSLNSRPSFVFGNFFSGDTSDSDRISPVGNVSTTDWKFDLTNQPSPFFPQYVLTGDYFYLEEMMFWASASSSMVVQKERGPGTDMAYFGYVDSGNDMESSAWLLKNRAEAAFVMPDGSPQKEYLSQLLKDMLSFWEGERNIHTGKYYKKESWEDGYLSGTKRFTMGISPLHFWDFGSEGLQEKNYINAKFARSAVSNRENLLMIFALGRAEELGFHASVLKKWAGTYLTSQITDDGYYPCLILSEYTPTLDPSGLWFTEWQKVKDSYDSGYVSSSLEKFISERNDADRGAPCIALAASSYLSDSKKGREAWSFLKNNVLYNPVIPNNPKWAIKPR